MSHFLLTTADGRQRLLTAALRIAHGTYLEPRDAERALLEQFVRGELTLDDLIAQLDAQGNVPALAGE